MNTPVIPSTVFGLMSLIIVTLAYAYNRKDNDAKLLQNKYDMLQDSRYLDAKNFNDKLAQPLQSIDQTLSLISDKIKSEKDRA